MAASYQFDVAMLAESLLKNRILEVACKKAPSLAARRAVAQAVAMTGMCSQRAACRALYLARSTCGYRGHALKPGATAIKNTKSLTRFIVRVT